MCTVAGDSEVMIAFCRFDVQVMSNSFEIFLGDHLDDARRQGE